VCDITVSIGTTITIGFEIRIMADVFLIHAWGVRVKLFNPDCFFKPIEFHGVKIRIVEMFPYSEKFYGIAVPFPVGSLQQV
jgi:hypothetical protein